MNDYLAELAGQAVEVYVDSQHAFISGQTLNPVLKKMIEFEGLLGRLSRKKQGSGLLRAFVDEPTLGRELLRNQDAVRELIERVKERLTMAYPDAQVHVDLVEDEEHQSNKIVCRMPTNGVVSTLEVNHELVGSADFRELQKLAPNAIGLGRPWYRMKVNDAETTFASTDELVRAILEVGKKGLNLQRYKGLGEMNPLQLWETTMNPETRSLLQVKLEDMTGVDEIFTILMGDEVGPRRNFIQQHALEVRRLDV